MEPIFQQLGIAVLLGLLVGLQREHVAGRIAGLRTFPLITVLGAVSAILADRFHDGWIVAAALLGVVALTVVGHLLFAREWEKESNRDKAALGQSGSAGDSRPAAQPMPSDQHPGITTDAAMLLMFAVGALVVVGPMPVAIAVGGGVAVLLQFKPELHNVAQKLGDADLRAIMQFVLITCIILPVLPNRNFDPTSLFQHRMSLDVLNPREIWLMVVLIVGLSLGGYISYKFFGRNAGTLLGGILGGAISSTATTVSYARRARRDPAFAWTATVIIMLASTVMYLRVLLAVAVVSQEFLQTVLLPVLILLLLTLLPAMLLWFRLQNHGGENSRMPEQGNPTQLKSAVVFGVLYALVLLALAAAKHYWNGRGLYAVAFLSGLTEVDALTLSTARMSATDATVASDGWRLIVVAAMANSVSKTAIAGLLGGWRLLAFLALAFAIPMLGSAALLAFL